MFNIGDCNGRLMLGCDVPTIEVAEYWRKHYQSKVGLPYPNGKGFYPDYDYHIVEIRSIH